MKTIVTVPLKNYRSVPVEPLRGKIVIDTNNAEELRKDLAAAKRYAEQTS